jgi:hypothetical protein
LNFASFIILHRCVSLRFEIPIHRTTGRPRAGRVRE